MFIDARQLSNGAVVEADIVIIGAGAAGISLALELIGRGLAVCLLEGGGMEFAWPSQSLYSGLNIGLPCYALDVCQLRYLGGSTNAWGGWCRPLDSIDFESRPSSPIRAPSCCLSILLGLRPPSYGRKGLSRTYGKIFGISEI